MKKLLLFLALASFVTSCSKDDLSTSPNIGNAQQVTVTLSTESEVDTRIALEGNEANGYTVTWQTDDSIGAWSAGDTSFAEFEIDQYDATKSTFKGSLSANATDGVRFVYPYSDAAIASSKLTIDLSAQAAEADLAHMGSTTYMMSSYMSSDAIDGVISMSHIGAAADVQIKCEAAANLSLTSILISGDMIPTVASIDLTAEDVEDCFTTSTYGQIAVSVPAFTSDNGIFEVPISILPFEIATGESITLTAIFEDEIDNVYMGSREIIASTGISFERATRNTLQFAITEELALLRTDSFASADFATDSSTTADLKATITLDELKFIWDGGTNTLIPKYNTSGYIQFYGGNVVTIATTTDKPITSIVFTHTASYSDEAELLVADSGVFNVESTSTTWSGVADEVVITNTAGGQVQIKTITVTYASDSVSENVVVYGSAADIYTKEDDTHFVLQDATVDYIYGYYTYVHTSDNVSAVIYQSGLSVTVGDIITVEGVISTYYSAKQLIEATITSTTTGGTAIEAKEVTVAEFVANYTDYLNQYICFKDVTVSGTTITQGDDTSLYYDGFKLEYYPASATCDIYGYGKYYTSPQIYPTAFDNVVDLALLSGVSPSTIEFTADSTSTETVTISGENIDDETLFTITNDNETNFTVAYTKGTTFTVTPTAANSSAGNYTATITVALSGVEKTVSVTQYNASQAVYAYTLVEDVADVTDGEYILACQYSSNTTWYVADGSNYDSKYIIANANCGDYFSNDSFVSNSTTNAITVTIKAVDGGCTVAMGDGKYVGWTSSTTTTYTDTPYTWTITDHTTYGPILYTADSTRALAFNYNNGSTPRFTTYSPSGTYPPANLYKKVEVE